MIFAILACGGMILTAGYMLWTIQRVYLGTPREENSNFPEITSRELSVLVPLSALAVLLGILPSVFVFVFTKPTVSALQALFG